MVLHHPIPDPFVFDIVLFFHAVPMFAAIAWRPDLASNEGKVRLGMLNFLMVLGWWVFLYAFIVFPHQYVVLNVKSYNIHYDRLYGLEKGLLLAVLAIAAVTSSAKIRKAGEGPGERSNSAAQMPMAGRDKMASMAMRGTTFFHLGWKLNWTACRSSFRAEREAAANQVMVATRGTSYRLPE